MIKKTIQLNNKDFSRVAAIFALLSDPTRLKILQILAVGTDDLCVTEIAVKTGLTLSAASHQLRKLEMLGVVGKCRKGQEICYCINSGNALSKKMLRLLRQSL